MLPIAILAGGLATRLRPLTETVPKALINIAGEPFLAHQLRLLKNAAIRQVVLCLGYRGTEIQEFAGDGRRFGLEIQYSFDGDRLLGTGGAIRRALNQLGESFFVLYGDSYLPTDYAAVEQAFRRCGRLGLMTIFENGGLWDTSNVEFSSGRILRYDKVSRSPGMRHIDYGLGAFHASVFQSLPDDQPIDLAAVYQELLQRDQLAGFEVRERFYEIGSVAGIEELRKHLARRPAVFLDRDGVLNDAIMRNGRPYPPSCLSELRIVPDAASALGRLKAAGFLLIVVTNQPDVARGTQTREAVDSLNESVGAALPIDGFYTCFHDTADGCDCRKPAPGLLLRAAADWNIDLARSFLIGDRWRDIDAGSAAGCRNIWIDRQYDERHPTALPDHRTTSLANAADWVLSTAQGA